LGSARRVITSNGISRDKYVYHPFGGEASFTINTLQTRRYTGKTLDEEMGLDLYYYGARYYDPTLGRFTQVDPLANKYPAWGPYVYCADNPLKYRDPNGKWLEPVHHYMIDQACAPLVNDGFMTREDVQAVMGGSDWADSKPNQGADKAYMHAMADGSTSPPQSPTDAASNTKDHINNKTSNFVETGDFSELGVAVHAVQDASSPSHKGSQKWTGKENKLQLVAHVLNELVPKPSELKTTVKATRAKIRWAIMRRMALEEEEAIDIDENE